MDEKHGEMSDTGDELSGDRQNLVANSGDSDDSDSENENHRSRRGKYTVPSRSKTFRHLPSWCQPENISRNERICLVAGLIAVLVIIVVFITVAVTASPARSKGNGGGGNGGGGSGKAQSNNESSVKWSDVRLQDSVSPNHYNISLSVDLNTFQVTGSVTIDYTVSSTVDYIALHVSDMDVSSDGHLLTRDGLEVEHVADWYRKNDFFIFDLSQPLSPGLATIQMKFNYSLRTDLAGFYRSSYKTAEGATRYLATTQFEPTDARRAFPCFDEPAKKANFTMQISHHSDYSAWFNMPLEDRSQPDAGGYVTSRFQTSVKMSSYLVAFIVSDFKCVSDDISSTSGSTVKVSSMSDLRRGEEEKRERGMEGVVSKGGSDTGCSSFWS